MSTEHVVEVLFLACVPAVNLYPLVYLFRPWRTTPQGRALMIKALGNMLLIDMIVAFQLLGDYFGRDTVRLVGMTLFCVGVWYLFLTLLRTPGAHDYPPFRWRKRR